MSPGEVVLEGVVVEQPAEPATAGEVLGRFPFFLGVKYVGREGIVGPLMSTDAVVDVFAMDRGLFDAANAATRHKTIATNTPRLASRSSRSPARRTT